MSLQLQNTLSGKKEFFKPVNPDHVRIYACGPTVYNFAHIGNARMAVVNDFCLLYTSPSPRDKRQSRMPSSA